MAKLGRLAQNAVLRFGNHSLNTVQYTSSWVPTVSKKWTQFLHVDELEDESEVIAGAARPASFQFTLKFVR